jgi:hypothetical protein
LRRVKTNVRLKQRSPIVKAGLCIVNLSNQSSLF